MHEDQTMHIMPLLYLCVCMRVRARVCVYSLNYYMLYVADIVIGVPSLQAHNLDAKIREERCRYLVAELVCRVRNF
jgi:hypothetical protein